ncbi:hypothetical protein [Anaerobranca gottschalkii]|uniref:Uncharacterized protein n=1 Tax=Anaerobranca gottschalkii DSM 13577 TaxID=1120990 RepID=A0A1H9ZF77_9FIRM|nr:hypothetical protein [Anaerobranca gottschalkii]SES79961.1 hypothetical protein SAMN03080614_100864 [Anaerobranca gottschalkii DSM 13577]
MFLKLKIIDRLSLKGIPNCVVELNWEDFTVKYCCNGDVIVGLPRNCANYSMKITAPMYKSIIYKMEKVDNNEQVVDLEFLDILDEDPVTA